MVILWSISWPRRPHVPLMPGQSPSDHVGQQDTEECRPAQQQTITMLQSLSISPGRPPSFLTHMSHRLFSAIQDIRAAPQGSCNQSQYLLTPANRSASPGHRCERSESSTAQHPQPRPRKIMQSDLSLIVPLSVNQDTSNRPLLKRPLRGGTPIHCELPAS